MQNPFNHLLDKEMDRKDFLVHIGAGLLAVLGFSSIFRALTGKQQKSTTSTSKQSSGGYGSSSYGR